MNIETTFRPYSKILRRYNMALRGAFVDPKGVRWDTNEADYEGWLSKKSKWMGEWRRRYFILKGSKLFFSKSSRDPPHGMIDLVDCISVKSAEMKIKKKNALLITLTTEEFYLFADSELEKDEWIGQIGKAIVRHSSMYVGNVHEDKDDDDDDSTRK